MHNSNTAKKQRAQPLFLTLSNTFSKILLTYHHPYEISKTGLYFQTFNLNELIKIQSSQNDRCNRVYKAKINELNV